MKIKKKNTTIPINGKIVDVENIEDKTSNAPSLRLVEEMIQDLKIEQADDFVIANEGYKIERSNIFKQGRHYFGWIVLKKISGNYTNSAETVATISKKLVKQTLAYGVGGIDNYWIQPTELVYVVMETNKNMIIRTGNCNYAKIHIDVVVE